ncbi:MULTISPECIES: two-partner secretion domain-containing protein [Calothrix]|uniref:S-layer family protein n=2 Tax=Calothrix TaxID=1186 RepID=A0ABR8ALV4_9CYAN|nr:MULTISPECIES: S-layer family protein [Calothrix]MBD2200273.1 S-layer family protein [Calothrix parietina FACHB-288]MBD2229257.1 S-layer family protein [Calothrix anomala FACHB-343]
MRAICKATNQKIKAYLLISVGLYALGCGLPVFAQVTSDGTTNTLIDTNGNNFDILNGSQKGNNLFHSFSNFSVPTGGSAKFDLVNTPNITTIFSRVTGGNASHIDGLIQTLNSNHPVSLFLINPKGIVFGQNAKLDISGSFIATTANSIRFADGVEFNAVNASAPPLLTMSVPVGLQMGQNPGAIAAQGTGYSLNIANILSPIIRTSSLTQLRVQPGKTLALVGGNLNLNGATLNAETGNIELGSVGSSEFVDLISTTQGYTLGYGNVNSFRDIQIAQKSLLDVSGVNAGSVQIQGKQIQFTDGSLLLAQNHGNLPGGNLSVQATESINLIGAVSGVRSETWSQGTGSNISVITPKLNLYDGGILSSNTYGLSNSGNIQVNAKNVEISGLSPNNATGSFINTSTFGAGNAGNIFIKGDSLLVSYGGGVSSVSRGVGSSGEIVVRNQDTTVQSSNSSPFGTRIASVTFNVGNAKTLTIDTARLKVIDGASVGTSSYFIGHAGDVRINATEFVEVNGYNPLTPSAINSSALILNSVLQKLFGLSQYKLTADAGTIDLTTPNLILENQGTVTVTNQGTGNAGILKIHANSIELKNQALIEARTESGNGGNIDLQVGKFLGLRDRSQITSTAGGNGHGGNISINSPILFGWENSDIVANAFQGQGGNININTQGIFGLEFRPHITVENDITASSEFGINGIVNVNNIGVDPNSALVELPANITDPSQQIASGCAANTGSSFIATGRGGVPQNPTQELTSDRTWSDIRDISAFQHNGAITAQIPQSTEVIVQATSWHRNAQGKIELVARQSSIEEKQPLTCAAIP